ncbi:DUF5367 domain-containing protein [Nostoc sp. UHCC 0251]|uniref:DUF5367 domain-containing protein n=1 Tax=Nostoc sp. UHCC 0251 TaxID=3110240 RepID=UPI002B21FFAD|nr:DUF5367 domain-containing protein [Nostoc sp. UHCC 0251]MEA5625953.1 DUF5367 domain-containing protein [Nostoc sp. UHCC 0251]
MQSTTQFPTSESSNKQVSYRFFIFLGFLIWLTATVILRLWGQVILIPDNNLVMGLNFLWSLLFLPLIVYGVIRWQNVKPQQRINVALCLGIPGMLLDVPTTYFFPQAFPNMSVAVDRLYGGWLLWGYAIVFLTGVISSLKRNSQKV